MIVRPTLRIMGTPARLTRYRWPLILLAGLALTLCAPPAAQAAAGDTKTICKGQSIPSGWVVAALTTSSCSRSYTGNAYVIVQIAGRPAGYDTRRCRYDGGQPSGWIIKSYVDGPCSTPGVNWDAYAIRNVVGLRAGTVETMCHFSPYPSGWVTVGHEPSPNCTTVSTDRTYNQLKIKNTQGLALGTVLTVCRGSRLVGSSPVPKGWTRVKDVYADSCRFDPSIPPPATNAFQIKRTS